jgi:sulfate adenylyltransferase subunit 1
VKHTTQEVKSIVVSIMYEIDINSLHRIENSNELKLNAIGRIQFNTAKPLFFDRYDRNRNTGSIIFINPQTNETVGAGIII